MAIRYFKVIVRSIEIVYLTIGNLAFRLALYLTGVKFRGKSQHVSHVGQQ